MSDPSPIRETTHFILKFIHSNFSHKSTQELSELVDMLIINFKIIQERVLYDVLQGNKVSRQMKLFIDDKCILCKIEEGCKNVIIEFDERPDEFVDTYNGFKYKWDGKELVKGELVDITKEDL